jgi:HK97 family phage major capsid protein
MKRITQSVAVLALAAVALAALALCAGAFDVQTALAGAALANGAAVVDLSKFEQAMKEAFGRFDEKHQTLRAQVLELAQKIAHTPVPGGGSGGRSDAALADLLMKSDALGAFVKGQTPSCTIEVPAAHMHKTAIINVAPGVDDPLRQADRSRGIVAAPEQRLTVRGLFTQVPTDQGSIDVVQEATFTNNAAIQGNDASPTGSGEGALKAESAISFTYASLNVPTIAHRITASRQVLSDAPRLQGHIAGRLLYGLALTEEAQFLTGTGTGLSMNGLNNQATAFTGGSTNATALDTLARAINQLQVANFEPTGIILHPTDWLAIKLMKDAQNRYLIGDPAAQTMPVLWGLPVVPTASQTVGKFTVLDARQMGYIADRETATVRISENVNDNFVRNLVTILAEERAVIVVERPTAIVYGDVSHAG